MCFIGISALLFCTRYLSAAIFGSGVTGWNEEIFGSFLSYTGNTLVIVSLVALLPGIVYLLWAEVEEISAKKEKAR